MIDRGRLYWAMLDKRRPVLVISPDARNQRATDVIVIPCSTRLRFAPTHVALRKGEGGVAHPSVLHCEQIATIRIADLGSAPLGARLSASRLREVELAVLRAIGVAT